VIAVYSEDDYTMSLNNVVNNLVRAAAGIPSDISDPDLDRHVAELLASEARIKEKSWSELGLSAFLGGNRDLYVLGFPHRPCIRLKCHLALIPTYLNRTNAFSPR
jgi:hypothetical protein